MRLKISFSGFSRWLSFLLLCLMACGLSASAQTTTFTGTVYSPLGPTKGDPIPNILVFIADPNNPPPVFTQGVVLPTSGQTGCAAQPALVPSTYLGEATTDYKGTYTFQTYGALPIPNINVVIQAGKWRLQTSISTSTITLGGVNKLPDLSMPSSHTTPGADLPHIAVVTGSADGIECIFRQIGISDSEITDTNNSAASGASIDLYEGASGGEIYKAPAVSESTLVSSVANLAKYDLVMFGCQSSPTADPNPASYANNLTTYTSASGRIFGTHYGYVWLEDNSTFKSVANWSNQSLSTGTNSNGTVIQVPATINNSGQFPQGATLASWMNYIGALASFTPTPTVDLTYVRANTSAVNSPAVSWANLVPFSQSGLSSSNSYTGTPSMQFSFDTPIGAAGTPTVAISYTNNTTTFTQGDTSDSITLTVTNNGTVATTPGLALSISLPTGISVTSLADSTGGSWTCTSSPSSPSASCTLPTALAAGAMDSVLLTFSILGTAPVGQVSLSASLSGGNITNSQQCGRVLYNDYHVENPAPSTGATYNNGSRCPVQSTLTNAQKFLEYSLYNLSNFVTPSTTDLITIEGVPTLAWTPAPNSIPYGTALTAGILDATATNLNTNSAVPGSFAYSYNGTTIAVGYSNLPTGNDTLSATFTLSDTADYTTPTPNPITAIIQVTPDATTTTLTNVVTPIYYGQIIAQAAVQGATSNGPASLDANGSLNFYINGVLACSIPWPVTPQPNCPATTGAGYDAGTYTVYSAYAETPSDLNFSPSTSPSYSVVVLPDVTTGTLTSSTNPSTPNQPITFTATIAAPYATPVGTVTFKDGTTVIGTGTVNASGVATLTLSSLLIGAHNITACYAAPLNASGTYNFLPICSDAILQIVNFPATITPTVTTLTSSENPSVVGQSVTFTSTVATTGAFIAIPTGTVNFLDGASKINSTTLDATGTVTYTTSTLTAGLHNITAVYVGTTNLATSTSPIVAQQVNTSLDAAATDFILTVTPTTFSVGSGSTVSLNVSVTELNNFNQAVQLSCTGLPYETTCAFDNSLIPATGGTTRLVISPAAPHNCGSTTPYFTAQGGRTGLELFAFATLIFMARRRKALKGIALAAALCLIPTLTGCSGNCTDLGLKPGTYTMTVTGTSTGSTAATTGATGAVTHSRTLTMTVTI